eukprot:GDKI01033630.1.p1 GENE.GDKI01033630.1~~GDKI01033630.1.p1  ORF type:complete len:112 (+),score=31.12 GDKI01033630.1:164-499(+)
MCVHAYARSVHIQIRMLRHTKIQTRTQIHTNGNEKPLSTYISNTPTQASSEHSHTGNDTHTTLSHTHTCTHPKKHTCVARMATLWKSHTRHAKKKTVNCINKKQTKTAVHS